MNPFAFLGARVRGFRILDIAAVSLIVAIALGSYAFKTFAGAEDADASSVESRIVQEEKRIRLLQAEIARLEQPRRIEDLSGHWLGLAAPTAAQEIAPADLARIAARPAAASPAPAQVSAP
jgi:hypothetical protein